MQGTLEHQSDKWPLGSGWALHFTECAGKQSHRHSWAEVQEGVTLPP